MYTAIDFDQGLWATVHSNQEVIETFLLNQVTLKLSNINAFANFKELLGGLRIHFFIYDSLRDPIENEAQEPTDGNDDSGVETHHRKLESCPKECTNDLFVIHDQDHAWNLVRTRC